MTTVYTLGHSTRTPDTFLSLLREHAIVCLVDVRRFPGSRRHPHFAAETLAAMLGAAGIDYVHEPDLGGYRKLLRQDSPNTAWTSKSFRAYADYMESAEFTAALEKVIGMARSGTTAIMCAEAVPWRCHRQLISDALVVRGLEVVHVLGPGSTKRHELNERAVVGEDGRIGYPAPPDEQLDLIDR